MKKALALTLTLIMMFGLVFYFGSNRGGGASSSGGTTETKKLDYPRRTIELVIPFGTAGSADICFRSVADILGAMTGKNVNAVNKPGAGGVIGLVYAFEQDADGYTLCAVTPSMPIAEAKGEFAFLDEFVPIALMEMDVFIISVLTSNPNVQDIESLVEYAKAHPGQVTIGGTSSGGLDEYEARQFAAHLGIDLTFVPYDSGGEHKAAFLGKELMLYMDKLSSFTPMLQYAEVKPILVINQERLPIEGLKDVPTTVEKGINFTTGSWRGLVVKKGTPPEIVDYLSNLCKKIYDSPEFQAVLKNDNADVIYGYKNAADFEQLIRNELTAYTKVVTNY